MLLPNLSGTVVIIDRDPDDYPQQVSAALSAGGVAVHRYRLDQPAGATLRIGTGVHTVTRLSTTSAIDLTRVGCVWWPHPHADDLAAWTRDQLGLSASGGGPASLLSGLRWLNHPTDLITAATLPHQFTVATQAGLRVPPTLYTGDPDQIRTFIQDHHVVTARPVMAVDQPRPPTNPITLDDLSQPERLSSYLFQKVTAAVSWLRVIVVDEHLFATVLDHDPLTSHDPPSAGGHRPTILPATLSDGLTTLTTRLRLRLATIDLAVTATGEHLFTQAHPVGPWDQIENDTGLPITDAITRALKPAYL